MGLEITNWKKSQYLFLPQVKRLSELRLLEFVQATSSVITEQQNSGGMKIDQLGRRLK
jgi:hypothetical protein